MGAFVALLRAVNVGGTGTLRMADLVALCRGIGLSNARTYIQSGNVVFTSSATEATVKESLEKALAAKLAKPIVALLRSAAELDGVLAHNPFKAAPPNRVIVIFLDRPPAADALADVPRPGGERLAMRGREIYVHYPEGQGRSKLKVPFADVGTGRNINTLTRLAEMAKSLALQDGA